MAGYRPVGKSYPRDDSDVGQSTANAKHGVAVACADLRPRLFAIAYLTLGTVSDAEEIAQEPFPHHQRALAGGTAGGTAVDSPKAWLAGVVTRLAIDHLRSARALPLTRSRTPKGREALDQHLAVLNRIARPTPPSGGEVRQSFRQSRSGVLARLSAKPRKIPSHSNEGMPYRSPLRTTINRCSGATKMNWPWLPSAL